jgi:hypothetical protein
MEAGRRGYVMGKINGSCVIKAANHLKQEIQWRPVLCPSSIIFGEPLTRIVDIWVLLLYKHSMLGLHTRILSWTRINRNSPFSSIRGSEFRHSGIRHGVCEPTENQKSFPGVSFFSQPYNSFSVPYSNLLFSWRPKDSAVSEDAGIQPWAVLATRGTPTSKSWGKISSTVHFLYFPADVHGIHIPRAYIVQTVLIFQHLQSNVQFLSIHTFRNKVHS